MVCTQVRHAGSARATRRIAPALLLLWVLAGSALAQTDDSPDTPLVVQAIAAGAVPEHATETAIDANGRVLINRQDGPILRVAYERTQTGTVLGISHVVSQLSVSIGAASPSYQGTTLIQGGAVEGSAQGPISYVEERANWRIGRQFAVDRLPFLLMPFVGVGELGWLRDFSGEQVFSAYYHQSVEGGLAAHASLGSGWTVDLGGSLGRTVGAFMLNGGSNPFAGLNNARGQRLSLGVDRRWFDDWHQGLRIEQEVWRFAPQATTTRLFEPLQRRDTAIMLVFSTERDLF